MRRAFAVLLALVASACATLPPGRELVDQGRRDLESSPLCCRTLAEAKRVSLPSERVRIALDGTSQAFTFAGAKSFFVLYELPPYTRPYSLLLTSAPRGRPGDMALVVPRVEVYDARFALTRAFDHATLRNRGNTLERTIFFNLQDAGERYLAIFAADLSSMVDRTYSQVHVQPVVAGPVIFYLYYGEDGKTTLRPSPVGTLELEVQAPAP